MRPVKRGPSPQLGDFANYNTAKPYLVGRLGPYCSYCERRINANLAVEHIQPKGLVSYAALEGRWSNFLLACVNCNSTKLNKDVVLSAVLLPDRDNTFSVFEYTADGEIEISNAVSPAIRLAADSLLKLVGLNKEMLKTPDENNKQIALDRFSQRLEAWGTAALAKDLINNALDSENTRICVTALALATGFFSIWMAVFAQDPDMRNRFIDGFHGTRASGCFDPVTTLACAASNPDGLADGAKV